MSSALRGRPALAPSAISRAQISPAFSSNGKTRPENRIVAPPVSKPAFQLSAILSRRTVQYSEPDFGNHQRGDKQILIVLLRHPGKQRLRWRRLGHVTDDVGIEQIASHRLTFRPAIRGRTRLRSAPTKGERRSAARMPPFCPDWRQPARRRRESPVLLGNSQPAGGPENESVRGPSKAPELQSGHSALIEAFAVIL